MPPPRARGHGGAADEEPENEDPMVKAAKIQAAGLTGAALVVGGLMFAGFYVSSMVAAGELTDGTLLRELYIALRVPDALRDILRGNVRQLRPNVLDACNARTKARSALVLETQSAGRPRTSAELALTVYWDMTVATTPKAAATMGAPFAKASRVNRPAATIGPCLSRLVRRLLSFTVKLSGTPRRASAST
ncbi:hypothetical protein CHLRE_10g435775v5 [Chlamydomonas reinhardtii]|uniref:Uncharacterized protein n=1 Tax=Chlamydomonas reinhardtii TaxID=3055 RepID=A0A2K3DA61_CHLRE|nr:uncharacterized protein CHLRE_10g435775v5 [Chlamydomonas reinhardtii]PNW77420.1 hypothetical protein CHLRE_10g435775v5 [Chlamydomonas reinhardtii]